MPKFKKDTKKRNKKPKTDYVPSFEEEEEKTDHVLTFEEEEALVLQEMEAGED